MGRALHAAVTTCLSLFVLLATSLGSAVFGGFDFLSVANDVLYTYLLSGAFFLFFGVVATPFFAPAASHGLAIGGAALVFFGAGALFVSWVHDVTVLFAVVTGAIVAIVVLSAFVRRYKLERRK